MREKFKNEDAAKVISRYAKQDELCKETMELFIQYLGRESANMVLKVKATGGLFIGGGIVPQIISLLENDIFYSSYCQSGRMNHLLEDVPVKIILNTKTALLGAAFFGAQN